MKPEEEVCDLDLATKLKELKVKQESLWYWVSIRKKEPELIAADQLTILEWNSPFAYKRVASAFTVAELGEMLPGRVYQKYKRNIDYWKEDGWSAALPDGDGMMYIHDKKEANMRAKLLIHLIKKGLEKGVPCGTDQK
ncbi:hypothetical protein IID24_03260 [Patescibacteria group bacterium]|nr:hypothetical protein [Patescibacteria group bacterium]